MTDWARSCGCLNGNNSLCSPNAGSIFALINTAFVCAQSTSSGTGGYGQRLPHSARNDKQTSHPTWSLIAGIYIRRLPSDWDTLDQGEVEYLGRL